MKIIVEPQFNNNRLDIYLHKVIKLPRNQISKQIKSGAISINDRIINKQSFKVKTNDRVIYDARKLKVQKMNEKFDATIKPPHIQILFENQDFIVINKPSNLLSHPIQNINERSVVTFLLHHCPKIKDVGEDRLRPGIVHRLDQDTSGILVVAKNGASYDTFKNLFKKRQIFKTYIAIVFGKVKTNRGIINKPIVRSPKNINRYLAINNAKKADEMKAKESYTAYKRLRYTSKYSLMELAPKTGRTHQLRVHLASIGHPIVGDKVYSFKNLKTPHYVKRQLLHAERLVFTFKDEEYEFEVPVPDDFADFLDKQFSFRLKNEMHSRYKPDRFSS